MSAEEEIEQSIEEVYDVWRREDVNSDQLYSIISSIQSEGVSFPETFDEYKKGVSDTENARIYTDLEGYINLGGEEMWLKIEGENNSYDIKYWTDNSSRLEEFDQRVERNIQRHQNTGSDDKDVSIEPVEFIRKSNGDDITAFDVMTVKARLSDLGEVLEPEPRPGKSTIRENTLHPYEFRKKVENGDYMAVDTGFVEEGMYQVLLDQPEDFGVLDIEGEKGRVMVKPDKSKHGEKAFKLEAQAPENMEAHKYLAERVDHFLNSVISVEKLE